MPPKRPAQDEDSTKSSRPRQTTPPSAPRPPRLPPNTPWKQGSGSTSNPHPTPRPSGGASNHRHLTLGHTSTTDNATQGDIATTLLSELNGAVRCDPELIAYLSCDEAQLSRVIEHCDGLNDERSTWAHPAPSGDEVNFYSPTIDIMNYIGRAVHLVLSRPEPYIPFFHHQERRLKSNYHHMRTSPDILRCQRPHITDGKLHWHDIDMFVEVKKDISGLREAMRQGARYARALFANRIDRRFIITAVVCGPTSLFIVFDRSGVIHSKTIDMYRETRKFIGAFAGLLMLAGHMAGYNPMFTNHWGEDADGVTTLAHELDVNGYMYHVAMILCQRIAIRSRATLVLGLQLTANGMERTSDNGQPILDAVLKLAWRDRSRFREGTILNQFVGVYGVCQPSFAGDVVIDDHPDVVRSRVGTEDSEHALAFGGSGINVDADGAQLDDSRAFSQLLMQPGRSIYEAENTFELVAGMIGALMGYWALINHQVLHRDISSSNILLVVDGYEYVEPEWERLRKHGVDPCALQFKVPEWHEIFSSDSEREYKQEEHPRWNSDPKRRLRVLQEVIDTLGREQPFGFLSDLDMADILAIGRQGPGDLHSHRTGTLMFMAVAILDDTYDRDPHSFIHDLESFFWVLLYVVALHVEPPNLYPNTMADRTLEGMRCIDQRSLAGQKALLRGHVATGLVARFETSWAKDLDPLLSKFALYLDSLKGCGTPEPDSCFEEVLSIFLATACKLKPTAGDN